MYNGVYKYLKDPNNRPLTKEDLYQVFGPFDNTQNSLSLYDELHTISGNDMLAIETQKKSLDEILCILKNIPYDIRQQNENVINRHSRQNTRQLNICKTDCTPILKEIIKDAIEAFGNLVKKRF